MLCHSPSVRFRGGGREESRYPQGCSLLQPPMRMTRQKLTEDTIAVWQPRTPRRLSEEDAREITENLTGFFAILAEWSRNEAHDGAAVDREGATPAARSTHERRDHCPRPGWTPIRQPMDGTLPHPRRPRPQSFDQRCRRRQGPGALSCRVRSGRGCRRAPLEGSLGRNQRKPPSPHAQAPVPVLQRSTSAGLRRPNGGRAVPLALSGADAWDTRRDLSALAQDRHRGPAFDPFSPKTEKPERWRLARTDRARHPRTRLAAIGDPSHLPRPRRRRQGARLTAEDDARPLSRRRGPARRPERKVDDRRGHRDLPRRHAGDGFARLGRTIDLGPAQPGITRRDPRGDRPGGRR